MTKSGSGKRGAWVASVLAAAMLAAPAALAAGNPAPAEPATAAAPAKPVTAKPPAKPVTAGAPAKAGAESKDEAAAQGGGEGTASLSVLRPGATARLDGAERAALEAMTADQVLALLNAPEGTQRTPTEQAIAEAFGKELFEQRLEFQTGTIAIGDGLATLKLGDHFRYLDPKNAENLLVNGWGNPPGTKSLGMIVPKDVSPLHDTKGWGVVITYSEDGHVDDDDAEDIDYDELLTQMKESTVQESKQREAAGYGTMALVGWAEPPRYDPQTYRLYWAQELEFGKAREHTLNYAIRVLGRKGVLELNAVAGMSQLPTIRAEMARVLPLAEFEPGQKYTDFNPDVDQLAAYGIGGLIAGKVLAKAGFVAAALKILIAAKKFLIFGLIALGGLVAKLFRKRAES